MTKEEEEKGVIRVCGENYEEGDIPAFIRKRDLGKLEAEERSGEEYRQECLGREERERLGVCVT